MCRHRNPAPRRGLTLIELLMAIAIMAVMAGVLGGLATAVHQSAKYCQAYGTATQHARVAMERIGRALSQATATEAYPGAVALADEVDGWRFPDTLVVWRPSGPPANAAGPPLMNELVIFCPDPDNVHCLLEVTVPGDTRSVPLNETLNSAAWRDEFKALARSPSSRKVVLTELLRAGTLDSGALRAAVRFECRLNPSAAEWASYKSGSLAWQKLTWPQSRFGSKTGLRQTWLRIELQLLPEHASGRADDGQVAIPFFGSSTLEYPVNR